MLRSPFIPVESPATERYLIGAVSISFYSLRKGSAKRMEWALQSFIKISVVMVAEARRAFRVFVDCTHRHDVYPDTPPHPILLVGLSTAYQCRTISVLFVLSCLVLFYPGRSFDCCCADTNDPLPVRHNDCPLGAKAGIKEGSADSPHLALLCLEQVLCRRLFVCADRACARATCFIRVFLPCMKPDLLHTMWERDLVETRSSHHYPV